MYEEKFPWIRDDVFLVARVSPSTGRQQLCMQQLDLKTGIILLEDSIDCIHTAVCDIPVEDFEETVRKSNFGPNILVARSSEPLKEIRLVPAEKFRALKSWVAGIAEAGEGAFKIQAEIEKYAYLMYPIADRLLRFVVQVDPSFLGDYLQKVSRECRYEGILHFASLRANLIPILDIIEQFPSQIPHIDDLIEEICDIIEEQETITNEIKKLASLWGTLGALLCKFHHYTRAAQAFERLIAINPENRNAWNDLALNLIWACNYAKAITVSNDAIIRYPHNHQAWNNLAYSLREMGEYDGALKACEKSLSLNDSYYPAWFTLGYLRRDRKDFDGAIIAWKRSIQLNNSIAGAWYELGNTYKAKGLIKKSRHSFSRAILLDPSYKARLDHSDFDIKPSKKFGKTKKQGWSDCCALKDRQRLRARRNAILKRMEYELLFDLHVRGPGLRGTKDAKSNRHHDGTSRKEAYRAWRQMKRAEYPLEFVSLRLSVFVCEN